MLIKATTQGVVSSVLVTLGETVEEDGVVLVTELMKMLSECRAPTTGRISDLRVNVGDVVEPGQILFAMNKAVGKQPLSKADDLAEKSSPLIEELEARRVALSDESRETRTTKRHASGGRTARENVEDLLDAGSFNEIGAHAFAAQHKTHSRERLIERSAADGVLVGTGTVDGLPIAILIVDYSVMAGTQGFFHHKKVDRIVDLVRRRKLPLIMFPEGGGGRPNDTDAHAISIAQLEITSFQQLATLRGEVPVISVVHGFCFAGSAAFAAVADVIIGTEGASMGMGGPAMIEGGGLGSFAPAEVGPAAVHAKTGVFDLVVADEAAATDYAKQILHMLKAVPSNSASENTTDLSSHMPADRRMVFDVHAVIDGIFDTESFVGLKPDYAPNMIIGLARIGGRAVGVLANNCAELGGAIDGPAADKAAHLMELCQTHNLPIISLIDTPGFMVGPEAEETGQVRPIGRFFTSGAKLNPPLIALVLRRAYGLGAMAMAGGSLHASDLTLSWPSGEFGAMGLEGAVRLGMRDQLAAISNEEDRKQKFERLVDELHERGRALNAAMFFEFDDVIKPDETRQRLILALDASCEC